MKILVISLAGIGDTLMATPLMHELRANFPDAVIEALVMSRGARDLLQANPHVNRVHQRNLLGAGKAQAFFFLLDLRRRKYDFSFNTYQQSRIHYRATARFINARVRVSHDYHVNFLDHWLVNRTIEQDYARHCIENNLALLSLASVKALLPRHGYELFLSPAEHGWAADFLAQHDLSQRQLVGIHVGSGSTKNLALRRWPLDHYIALIQQLTRAIPKAAVLLFGGPDEEGDHAKILGTVDRSRVFAPKTANIRETAALVGRCSVFLSVDTALMHLAAAMKVPRQIVIETPTFNHTVEPYNQPFLLLKNSAVAGKNLEYYCYDGAGIRGTAAQLRRCMESIRVEDVFQAVNEALMKTGADAH
ncbi:MAG TPA: glycosyltransferase family 9 protein [Verrucomicrobiae bacterium]|nr:glycosyltransferase family 9 protein [Verrucomicrobiae bacterium]